MFNKPVNKLNILSRESISWGLELSKPTLFWLGKPILRELRLRKLTSSLNDGGRPSNRLNSRKPVLFLINGKPKIRKMCFCKPMRSSDNGNGKPGSRNIFNPISSLLGDGALNSWKLRFVNRTMPRSWSRRSHGESPSSILPSCLRPLGCP